MDLLSIIVVTLVVMLPGQSSIDDGTAHATIESGVGRVAVDEGGATSFDPRALADRLIGDAPTPVVAPETSVPAAPVVESSSVTSDSPRPLRASMRTPLAPLNAKPAANAWWQAPELRVLGLLTVMGAGAWMLKRWKVNGARVVPGRPAGVMSILARYPFGRGSALVLVECGPKIILLHQHAGRGGEVTALSEFSSPEEVAGLRTRLGAVEREADPAFAANLENHLGAYDRTGRARSSNSAFGVAGDEMDMVDLTRRRPRWGTRKS